MNYVSYIVYKSFVFRNVCNVIQAFVFLLARVRNNYISAGFFIFMPVRKCSNGKWRIGSGKCMYDTKKSAMKSYKAYLAKKHSR